MINVLLVDDDMSVRESITVVLNAKSIGVDQASTSAEAINFLNSEARYDLVLLDLWLGNDSGLELLSSLKDSEHASLPVIVISGGGAGHSLEQAIALADARGADHVLIKPFRNVELIEAIMQVLSSTDMERENRA